MLLMIVSVVLMFTLRYATDEWDWLSCHEIAGGGSVCFGITSAFRASFSLAVFHGLMLLFIFPRAQCSSAVHDGFWGFKILVLALIFIISFWIPYQFFIGWGWVCLVLSAIFLIIQAYFLLNLAYTWMDILNSATENATDGTYAHFLLLCYSIVTLTGSIVWLVFQFIWFGHCGFAKFVLIVTCFFSLFFVVASLLKLCNIEWFRENATIFVASLGVTYITYLSWTALASNPDAECNPFIESPANTIWQIVSGVVFTGITIISIATASVSRDAKKNENTKSMGNDMIAEDADGDAKAEGEENEKSAIFPVTIPTLIFQGVMLFASFYYGMLFSNWGNLTVYEDNENIFPASVAPMWIKIVA